MTDLQQEKKQKKAKKVEKEVDLLWIDDHIHAYARKIKEKTGLTVLDPENGVGCGSYGCVFLTDDPRWVVKVTGDKDEGPMAQRIVEIRQEIAGGNGYGPSKALQGIVFFRNVFRARTILHHRKHFKPYVIVRENCQPTTERDVHNKMAFYVDKGIDRNSARPGLEIAQRWAEKFHKNGDDVQRAVKKYIYWLSVIRDEFPLIVDDMLYLMEHDLVLADVHAYNVGYTLVDWGSRYRSPGSVVIYDLGMTPTNPRTAFKTLNPILIDQG